MSPMRVLSLSFLLSLPTLAAVRAEPQASSTSFPMIGHRELGPALRRIAAEHPDVAAVVPVGFSRAGREIEALRLASGERTPGRPAILVVANVDGPYAWTSGLALELAGRIARGRADDPKLGLLLERTTLYFVPRANPDAAEARFEQPLAEVLASGPGVDQDRDGRDGEDGPSDVDGDGLVTTIRVADPEGLWIADPTDARALRRADSKRGERGTWKVWPEGRDSDRDEKVGEDPALDVVVNQNFPHGWEEHAPAAGKFATGEPEARALCDFVLAHEEIALVVVYGALDNLVEKPKSVREDAPFQKRLPPEGVLEPDAELLAEIGRRYAELGDNQSKSAGVERGSFSAWCQMQRGLWCLAIRPWSIPLDEPAPGEKQEKPAKPEQPASPGGAGAADEAATPKEDAPAPEDDPKSEDDQDGAGGQGTKKKKKKDDEPKPTDDAKRLRWVDAKNEGARFVPWKPFEHPELGPVEIGGFAPYATIEPPASEHEGIAARELALLASLGGLLPRVAISSCSARSLGADLWEIEAAIENAALLPLLSASARRTETVRPARVRLRLPPGARLVAGPLQELVSDLGGSGGRRELRWIVQGAPAGAFEVEVDTSHAGTARATPEVK